MTTGTSFDTRYSSGLEVRILKNLGSTDRILKAKICQSRF